MFQFHLFPILSTMYGTEKKYEVFYCFFTFHNESIKGVQLVKTTMTNWQETTSLCHRNFKIV
jgi:hypothetical protein